MNPIFPSIIGSNQNEFNERYQKVKTVADIFHLDVMDGDFVANSSLNFGLELPAGKWQYHLMVRSPLHYVGQCAQADVVIIQCESEDVAQAIQAFKQFTKVGLAISPDTPLSMVEPFIEDIDLLTIMTVVPGNYGSTFRKDMLARIQTCKQRWPHIPILVDGAVAPNTIGLLTKAHADYYVCGSYLQNHPNPHEGMKMLLSTIHKKSRE